MIAPHTSIAVTSVAWARANADSQVATYALRITPVSPTQAH